MNAKEKNVLGELSAIIGRLDERSINTWRAIEEIKELLEKQNGRIRRNSIAIAVLFGTLGIGGGTVGIINLLG